MIYKYLATVSYGFEEKAQLELQQLVPSAHNIILLNQGNITFSSDKIEKPIHSVYIKQLYLCLIIDSFDPSLWSSNIDEITTYMKSIFINNEYENERESWDDIVELEEDRTFKVNCVRSSELSEGKVNSSQLSGFIGAGFVQREGWKVDLHFPIINLLAVVTDDSVYIGLQLNYLVLPVETNNIEVLKEQKRLQMTQRFGYVKPREEKKLETGPVVKPEETPWVVQRAEMVLKNRTDRVILVMERCVSEFNEMAVLRTCENMGIHNIWIVKHVLERKPEKSEERISLMRSISRLNGDWMDVRYFESTIECIYALREDNRTIWATDLGLAAESMEDLSQEDVPERLAVVMGRETDGVSEEMLQEADKRVYLPMFGFSDSLNLSVATALVLQKVFYLDPTIRGSMDEEYRQQLRIRYYDELARDERQRELFRFYENDENITARPDGRRLDEHRGAHVRRSVMKKMIQKENEKREEFLQKLEQSS
eukprot:TRINITY_DN8529_c0_g1_i1.p1 TRINITY_DN8529_c0_g1~~TRINITY_DN8529_c0_g1_i1.p1  ORF type:complete len:482 (-),score=120.99 TRINITY_DN8529_c0_g1_i1:17-1462(-)